MLPFGETRGIKKYIKNNNPVFIPHKKTKNSPLTPQKKEDNRIIAGLRIVVEHTIAGIKRFQVSGFSPYLLLSTRARMAEVKAPHEES